MPKKNTSKKAGRSSGDCCLKNLPKAKRISRAKYVCPKCGIDVSLAYVLYQKALSEIIRDDEKN